MGLKDPLGHDLGHLYVESTDPHLSTSVPWSMVEKPTMDKVNSGKEEKEVSEENTSSGDSEESTHSDNESEQLRSVSVEPCLLTKTHRQLCRSPCLEPHILKRGDILQDFKPEESQTTSKEVKKPPDVVREYQTKLEFALKLGYSEEQVQLVLNKLGTDALINDILGELVKLGNKSETEQTVSTITSVTRDTSSLESQRSDSPMQEIVADDGENLRPVVIDGSNVAMSHGNKEVFSCRGIKLAVDWFLERGHKDVTVFVPAWRKEQSRPDALITDQEILRKLEKEKILVFTPSRRVQGRRVVCYDDRFIVKLAFESDGIIVSNDNYRDLANEKPEWKKFIDERLLMYSFVNDKFMPPDDPLGRHGPSLDNFLRKKPIVPEHKKQPCPYGQNVVSGYEAMWEEHGRKELRTWGAHPDLRRGLDRSADVFAAPWSPAAGRLRGAHLQREGRTPASALASPVGKKCTYGHKCKYYHPERGSQPQRSVADELRAMSRNTAAKTSNEGGLVKSNSVPCSTKADSTSDVKRGAPKRQSDPSIRTQVYQDLEEKLPTKNKLETRSVPSLVSIPATSTAKPQSTTSLSNGLPSGVHFPAQDQRPQGQYPPMMMATKNHGTPMPYEQYPKCDSPVDIGYYSMLNAYSNLSISGPRSPERRFSLDTDYRVSSVASDCSSEGSMSCGSSDSYVGYNDRSYVSSPDPQLEESLKCQHVHPHSRLNSQPFLQNFHDPLARVPSYSHEEPKYHPKPPLAHLAVHLPHPAAGARSSCPGDYPSPPGAAHPKAPRLGRSLLATRLDSVSDSRLYDGSPSRPRKPYSGPDGPGGWERPAFAPEAAYGYRHTYSLPDSSTQPGYEPFAFQSLPERPEPAWRGPYCAPPPEPPRYQDDREKVYVNLCNIFPADLVRTVMKRNPHVTDAQQLAAAILVEKSQLGY
ncbi:probable ribonuclease ZC3H12C isoform X11 [Canis lupus familiaris]|nr:probable ribonuclease ZC3H12C isoform X11 [Canis lupus familiaris]XP_038367127.1 probable ribonuclease ZC3H12C isoform X11 [Canis lupus familiaris]XP_038367133.1 probable ribonuclease ZC3H12C isoform X11 [Canis lupus familiaris]XP_038367134.1 probable ribonuclease ZC3H12C isoform X11 [Canis lupus familiaris]XP_038367137.1 probable ribonuclease ZC3H12C isoform X11 [Canis lupus familiaris]XP_038367143.1 probable ribonuclease ZC3H12C isoform X11 [Canis lupus familiaris]